MGTRLHANRLNNTDRGRVCGFLKRRGLGKQGFSKKLRGDCNRFDENGVF